MKGKIYNLTISSLMIYIAIVLNRFIVAPIVKDKILAIIISVVLAILEFVAISQLISDD